MLYFELEDRDISILLAPSMLEALYRTILAMLSADGLMEETVNVV